MPTFEYSCPECEILFEELLLQGEEIEKYRESHPCPQCKKDAPREKVSLTNFAFKAPGGPVQGSGVHGQSGVHDLDYPKLDKAIGRSASKKWKQYHERKAQRDKVRKESGTNTLVTTPEGKAMAADKATQTIREQALGTFSKVKKAYEGK